MRILIYIQDQILKIIAPNKLRQVAILKRDLYQHKEALKIATDWISGLHQLNMPDDEQNRGTKSFLARDKMHAMQIEKGLKSLTKYPDSISINPIKSFENPFAAIASPLQNDLVTKG